MICGQVPCAAIGTDAFQEAPVFNIMSACAKHVFLCKDSAVLEDTVRTAFKLARSGRPGPVVIDVPKDVQNAVHPFKGTTNLKFRGYEERLAELNASRMSKEDAAGFFKMLANSDRPLLYVGGGIIHANAAEELRKFAKRFRIPVVTSLMGIGSVDTSDELSLHMVGMHGTAYANYAVEDCDFVIAIGARFDDRVAAKVDAFAPNAKYIAHIDIDAAEIGKVKAPDWAHVGDAKQALRDLLAHGKGFKKDFSKWVKYVNALKKKHRMNYDHESDLIQPYEVIEILNEITGGDAVICTGVGQHQMWAAQYCRFHHPRSFITSGSMGTMGFGLPSSIGAQVALPDRTVIDIDGDGSMRMNLGELETLTTYNVPVKILLLNNLGDGMVRQWQTMYFGERYAGTDKSLHRKDFVKAAEANGFTFAKRLNKKTNLKQTLKKFVAYNGPALLEVMIDPYAKVLPMVGPGMGYKEMITGDFIVPRETPSTQHVGEEIDMMKIPDLF
jgi:acetolactate synthase I/II/III large subunit